MGHVGSGARITLVSSQFTNQIRIVNNVIINNGSTGHELIVQGNVHNRANITGSSNMEFRGYLSDFVKVKTKQGSIIVKGNVGSNSTLKSMSGAISAGDVGSNSTLKSMSGAISAGDVGSNSTLKSMSGNISVLSRDPSATMTTMSGTCYENGRPVNRRQNRSNITINGTNVSFDGGSFSFNTNDFSNSFFYSGATPTRTSRQQAAPTRQMGGADRNASSNEEMSASLQSYIMGFNDQKESFQAAFHRLKVDASEKYKFLSIFCTISLDIPNIPVSLNSRLYDWNSLKSNIEKDGYIDPLTRKPFALAEVAPDRTTFDSLEGIIKEEEKINKGCRSDKDSSDEDPKGYYAILELRPDTADENFQQMLRRSYCALSMMWHPDKCTDKAAAHKHFLKIQEAYNFFLVDGNREKYGTQGSSNSNNFRAR